MDFSYLPPYEGPTEPEIYPRPPTYDTDSWEFGAAVLLSFVAGLLVAFWLFLWLLLC